MAFIGLVGAAVLPQSFVDRQYATNTHMNANSNKIKTIRMSHFRIRFINRRFEVSCGCRSWTKSSSDSSLHFVRRCRLQSFNEKPKADDQFEQSHRKIEPPVINDFVEVRENQIDESAKHAPGRGDHTVESQSSRNVVRLEPQPGANGRGQSKERQADVIVIKIRAEI